MSKITLQCLLALDRELSHGDGVIAPRWMVPNRWQRIKKWILFLFRKR